MYIDVMVVGLVFYGDSRQEEWGASDVLPGLGILSLLLGCLAQSLCEGLCLILLCFVVTVFG